MADASSPSDSNQTADDQGKAKDDPSLVSVNETYQDRTVSGTDSQIRKWKIATFSLAALSVALAAGLIAASVIAQQRGGTSSSSAPSEFPPFNANAVPPSRVPSHGFLWPKPANMTFGKTTMTVSRTFTITVGRNSSQRLASAIARYNDRLFPIALDPATTPSTGPKISSLIVSLNGPADDSVPTHLQKESYRLRIPADGTAAQLTCDSTIGCIRGLETFSQLIEPMSSLALHLDANRTAPTVSDYYIFDCPWVISDAPRFSWRGIMLDTARHYFPVADLKRVMDGMEASKLNVFHWHIVDSQSFPFSFAALPQMAQPGAYSPASVYTEDDIRELVDYAADRGINIVPEFDLPGHTQSWGRALPNITVGPAADSEDWWNFCYVPPCGQLDVQDRSGAVLRMLDTLFKTVAQLFPYPYLHLGGDEINLYTYNTFLPKYSSNDLAQFFERLYKQIDPLNKTIIHWQDLLTDNPAVRVDTSRAIQVWGDPSLIKQFTSKGYQVIASPSKWLYLDCGIGDWLEMTPSYWCDPYKTWRTVHLYDPAPDGDPNVLGAEVALWTESTDSGNLDSVLWPRSAAGGERWWSPKDTAVSSKEIWLTRKRLDAMRTRLVRRGIKAMPVWPEWCYFGSGNSCD